MGLNALKNRIGLLGNIKKCYIVLVIECLMQDFVRKRGIIESNHVQIL